MLRSIVHARAIASALAAMVLLAILACVDTAQAPSAAAYASDASARSYAPCDATDVASVVAGLASTGRPNAFASAEADRLAADVARVLAAGHCEALTGATESRLGYRAGLYDHHLEISSQRWTGHVDEAEVAAFARELGVRPAEADLACPVAVGAARVSSGAETLVVLVTAARCATFASPLPRVLRAGATLSLQGAVTAGEHPQSIQLTTPEGRVESSTLAATGAPAVSFAWQRALTPGRYVLELVGVSDRSGPTPLAKAELLVGIDPPSVAETCRAATPQPIADALTQTLVLLNGARSTLGLSALALEPHLVTAAQQHSDEMVQLHYFAHWSPSGSTPASRAQAAGAPVTSTAENIATGLDASEMHDELMESPGHRRSILDPSFTHVGLGLTLDDDELTLTELFGTIPPPLDLARDRPLVIAALGATLGRTPSIDPRLEAAAQAAAERFFVAGAPSDQAVREDALAHIASLGAPHAQCLSSRVGTLASPPRFDGLGAFDHFGVGLAQGHRADGPPGEYLAVVLAAQLQEAAVDTVALERHVLDLVDRARAASHAPPLEPVDALTTLARGLARRWLAGEPPATLYEAAAASRSALGLRQEGLGYQCGGITAAEDVLAWSVPLDPAVRRIGIGIVQGDHAGVSGALGVFVVGVRP